MANSKRSVENNAYPNAQTDVPRCIGGISVDDIQRAKAQGSLLCTHGKITGERLAITAREGLLSISPLENKAIHFTASVRRDYASGLVLATFNYSSKLPDGTKHPDFRTHDLVRYAMADFQEDFGEIDGVSFIWEDTSTSNYTAYVNERDRLFVLYRTSSGLRENHALNKAQIEAAQQATWDGQVFASEEFGFTYLERLDEMRNGTRMKVVGRFLREEHRPPTGNN